VNATPRPKPSPHRRSEGLLVAVVSAAFVLLGVAGERALHIFLRKRA
jgi:hypothetical protein